MKSATSQPSPFTPPAIAAAFSVATLAAGGLYLLMEWVFFATKPSFMSTLGVGERLRILLLSPLPLAALTVALAAALALLTQWLPRARSIVARVAALGPGLGFAATALLLLDNVAHTLWQVSVATTTGWGRVAAALLFGGLWAAGWRVAWNMMRGVAAWSPRERRRLVGGAAALLVGGAALWATEPQRGAPAGGPADAAPARPLPNIILFAADGLSAEHLSLYGYDRDTTPFIRQFRPEQRLLCENAFANSLNSSGSIASLLTSKQTTTLRLYYPPEILTGKHAFEHLPGILQQLGYFTLDISVRHFADAYDLNMQHAFHEANGRRERRGGWGCFRQRGLSTGYFLAATSERLTARLRHLVGARDMESAYAQVAGAGAGDTVDDEPRLQRLLQLIQQPPAQPFFVHLHLLQTHGPHFNLAAPEYSRGRSQTVGFETDFYDDAIRAVDASFARVAQALEAAGLLDNTLLVFSTDHGYAWSKWRIPLVFWFPGGEPAGRRLANTQNVDIAPTILDFLGRPIPPWMEGVSLLAGEPPATRPIYLTAVNSQLVDTKSWSLDHTRLHPPFYSLGVMAMRIGARHDELNLISGTLTTEPIPGHTAPLAADLMPSPAAARRILLDHLRAAGYAVPDRLLTAPATPPATPPAEPSD
ncbi:MAG TPA: sulfatase-like hydrolase/transferase [Kiritimatiellia bacterium]|nr:sulfatase-like hydrolase/transferase [Kiritimatiellia bacterium]HQG74400.1 sulfatase-like hydrolase/transferase [Kiritimatiellia bacterium]